MTYELLSAAVREIAVRCDGAEAQDGVGFNGTDSHFGKAIAGLPHAAWTDGLARQAWEMLRKYKGQLAEYGVDYDEIPEPQGEASRDYAFVEMVGDRMAFRFPYNPDLIDKVKRGVPGARWNGAAKVWTAPPTVEGVEAAQAAGFIVDEAVVTEAAKPREDKPAGRVVLDGESLVIAFDYDPRLVAAVKDLSSRRFDPGTKHWVSPLGVRDEVVAFAERFNLTVDPAVLALDAATVAEASRPKVGMDGRQFALTFDYDRALVEATREIPGARWDGYSRRWLVDPMAAFEVLQWATRCDAIIDLACAPFLEGALAEQGTIAASAAADADLVVPGLLKELMPFQRAGVAYALKALGFDGPVCMDCAADPEGLCGACDAKADADNAAIWASAEKAYQANDWADTRYDVRL